jgi:hypothetical protein
MQAKFQDLTRNVGLLGAALGFLMFAPVTDPLQAQILVRESFLETQTMSGRDKFYCNINALSPSERTHHKALTEKLISVRTEAVETEKGYEFRFTPSAVSLAELADWVATEGKCCPFFDFHIDLENRGDLLCLRLTGEEEIKPFIRAEFRVPAK